MTISPFANEEYTVGWICALPIELAAAKGMLDEEHGAPQTAPQSQDANTYILGSIARFKAVMACLPKHEIGSSSAAVVAKDMLSTFPKIRAGLLVGIGAGIPNYDSDDVQDIRLGDVVISSDSENGGVVLFDSWSRPGDGPFRPMYALNRPPRAMRTAMAKLEAEHLCRENRISEYIQMMLDKSPVMCKRGYIRPDQSTDRLFESDYRHVSGKSCRGCEAKYEIYREPRFDSEPVVHYGVIATGSAVMKHGPTRDEIRRSHGAICLEMEAAGVMNIFPCVVVRGISDYCDSHKVNLWKPYAAASAAACAKELLETMEFTAVDEEQSKDVDNVICPSCSATSDVSKLKAMVTAKRDWLSLLEYHEQEYDILSRRQSEIGLQSVGEESRRV